MELVNEFRIAVPVDDAWAMLTDLQRIAPYMPGARLEGVEGEEYLGVVKVKVGPITVQYKGTARMLEKDDVGRRAVIRAEGRESRGQGNASATVTATIRPDGDGTIVLLVTELTVTGKVAQFGRGVMGDVSTNLLGQFASRLEAGLASEAEVASELGDASGSESRAAVTVVNPAGDNDDEPVDLFKLAGSSVAKRAAPMVVAAVVLSVLVACVVRRRRSRGMLDRTKRRSRCQFASVGPRS